MSKLSYICNSENIQQLHEEVTKNNGVYFFIRKLGEKSYHAYRKVVAKNGAYYFVKVGLPKEVFTNLIVSGKVPQVMDIK